MPLRIACDLDGTVADMESALQAEAERLFGPGTDLRASLRTRAEGAPPAAAPDPTATMPGMRGSVDARRRSTRLSDRQLRQLWSHVRGVENFWASLKEVEPGAVARLAAAAASCRWDVLFITTRPPSAGETTQLQSQRWLESHGFERPSVYVVSGSRGRIASALTLDAVIDDRAENCFDVATESEALPLLVWRGAPEAAPAGAGRLGVRVVSSLAAAVAHLESMTTLPAGAPGLLARVRGVLGI